MSCDHGQISDLMDGRLAGAAFATALDGMDDEARAQWRLYHVVGDTLRARDLCRFGTDTDFVGRLRDKLGPQDGAQAPAAEAIALPPVIDTARGAANDGSFRWKMVAGLASFLAVSAIGWNVIGLPGPAASVAAPVVASAGSAAEMTPTAYTTLANDADGDDTELGHLLAAHRQVAGDAALDGMTGFIHNVAYQDVGH